MLPTVAGHAHARVLESSTASIHGDLYFDLLVELEPPREPRVGTRLRVPQHACHAGLMPVSGDRVRLETLMGQVTAISIL